MATQVTSTPIEAVLATPLSPLSPGWNKIPGISVSGRRVTIHPAEFFFEYTEPQWVLCDWDLVRRELLGRGETRYSTYPPPRLTAEVPEREP